MHLFVNYIPLRAKSVDKFCVLYYVAILQQKIFYVYLCRVILVIFQFNYGRPTEKLRESPPVQRLENQVDI
jgi:hypothetical protein